MGFVDKIKNAVSGDGASKAKDALGGAADKAGGALGGVAGKAESVLESGVDKVDDVTGGKYTDKLDKAKNVIDKIDSSDNNEAEEE